MTTPDRPLFDVPAAIARAREAGITLEPWQETVLHAVAGRTVLTHRMRRGGMTTLRRIAQQAIAIEAGAACSSCLQPVDRPHTDYCQQEWTAEDHEMVAVALLAAAAGNAGHWPTVAGWLGLEVQRLRALLAKQQAEPCEQDDQHADPVPTLRAEVGRIYRDYQDRERTDG